MSSHKAAPFGSADTQKASPWLVKCVGVLTQGDHFVKLMLILSLFFFLISEILILCGSLLFVHTAYFVPCSVTCRTISFTMACTLQNNTCWVAVTHSFLQPYILWIHQRTMEYSIVGHHMAPSYSLTVVRHVDPSQYHLINSINPIQDICVHSRMWSLFFAISLWSTAVVIWKVLGFFPKLFLCKMFILYSPTF